MAVKHLQERLKMGRIDTKIFWKDLADKLVCENDEIISITDAVADQANTW